MWKITRPSVSAHSNIFTWLDEVRERRGMWVQTLHELESKVYGYYTALGTHCIVEPVPSMTDHFLCWLRYRTRWSTNRGWAIAIEQHVTDPDKQFDKFFRLVDEYRKLVPTVLYTTRLKKQHQPTGKRVVYGFDGRMERPKRVDILRYVPEPLHFLRFHYPHTITDGWLLHKGLSHDTTIYDAKRWVRDELQVKQQEWENVVR
jgi:hypothetical protein